MEKAVERMIAALDALDPKEEDREDYDQDVGIDDEPHSRLLITFVAFMSRGAAVSRCKPLKRKGNSLQHVQQERAWPTELSP
jgi:hypothetical protein